MWGTLRAGKGEAQSCIRCGTKVSCCASSLPLRGTQVPSFPSRRRALAPSCSQHLLGEAGAARGLSAGGQSELVQLLRDGSEH